MIRCLRGVASAWIERIWPATPCIAPGSKLRERLAELHYEINFVTLFIAAKGAVLNITLHSVVAHNLNGCASSEIERVAYGHENIGCLACRKCELRGARPL